MISSTLFGSVISMYVHVKSAIITRSSYANAGAVWRLLWSNQEGVVEAFDADSLLLTNVNACCPYSVP